ncbi:VOC family protein [Deinococcus sp. QL22]|uniref:VOC family protein n=1 Tax=Deinococcus sp. QL22 TaxID=2939437 RepID=UPI002017229D|nr:VOC family protein [Deinococcus sp. QL22]UQN10236.1 VOC family protein [Deinococcus sp. QL22]
MTYPAGEPSWTDLATPMPDRSKAFYTTLFGWEYGESSEEYGHYAMAFQGGKLATGLVPLPPGAEMPSAWTVYFASDNIAADAEQIVRLGGQVVMGPMLIGDQGHMGVFSDPTGATFGLWQAGNHQGFEACEGDGSVVWVEINTRDSARALAFYTTLFGADSTPLDGLDYHQLRHGEQGYAGVSGMGENWEAVAGPHWVTYFYVADVDRAAQLAQEQGGKVLVAPFDMSYGRMAVLADPAGATFSVMNPQPAGG